MRKILLGVLLTFLAAFAYGQNKTLGVGTVAPNPNAALHVESPTSNQGFIMPRLTTAQRTAPGFQGVLSGVDVGLMVYDTDLKGIYVWDGAAWGGAAKLSTPYKDSTAVGPNQGNLFDLRYNGTDTVGIYAGTNYNPNNPFAVYFGVNAGGRAYYGQTNGSTHAAATFRVLNGASTRPAVEGVTNSNTTASTGVYGGATGTGANAGFFQITNAANNKAALVGETNGLGYAGRFSTTNAANTAHALYAESNADTLGAAIHGNNIGNGFGVFGKSAGTDFASAAVYGEHVGTGDAAGAFRISNLANTYSALYGETNGSGPAIFANNLGTGRAGQFQIGNATSTSAALRSFTNGLGNAGFFTISNAVNDSSALYITTNGTGNAITANAPIQATQFIGDGSALTNLPAISLPFSSTVNNAAPLFDVNASGTASAGRFSITNPSSTAPALFAQTDGIDAAIVGQTFTGFASIYGRREGATNGNAGFFEITDAANIYPALQTTTVGSGPAGSFLLNKAGTLAHALYAQSNGDSTAAAVHGNNVGNGFGVFGKSAGNKFASAAVYGEHVGTGDAAGAFRISNASNSYAGLYGETNGSGSAIRSLNLGSGNGAYFRKNGANPSTAAMWADNFGTAGYGAIVQNVNATNPTAALFVEAVGTGPSVLANKDVGETGHSLEATNSGTNGHAGNFYIIDASNSGSAVNARTDGTGSAISALSTANGSAGNFEIANGGNSAAALSAQTNGSGPAVNAINNGTSFGIYTRAIGTTDALYATKESGDGTGSAGNFNNQEATNNASTLFSMTNAPGGSAVGALNSGNGNALSIFTGGVKVSTATLDATVSTVISNRAAAYLINNASSSFTFSGGIPLSEGEVFYFFNADSVDAIVESFTIEPTTGAMFIYLGGALRVLNGRVYNP